MVMRHPYRNRRHLPNAKSYRYNHRDRYRWDSYGSESGDEPSMCLKGGSQYTHTHTRQNTHVNIGETKIEDDRYIAPHDSFPAWGCQCVVRCAVCAHGCCRSALVVWWCYLTERMTDECDTDTGDRTSENILGRTHKDAIRLLLTSWMGWSGHKDEITPRESERPVGGAPDTTHSHGRHGRCESPPG